MRTEMLTLAGASPGQTHTLKVLRFGHAGAGPKAYVQAALHADEVPALLVAQQLRGLLEAEEAAGRVVGEVVLVPYANPVGLGQAVLGQQQGRFDLRDGINFNREVPDLGAAAAAALEGRLGPDEATNTALARQALREAAAALSATDTVADLKIRLLQMAADADIVLDLHCDAEAALHLYALTPQADIAVELGRLLGARAILLATESGGGPFDEACSKPWLQLQQRFAGHPLRLGCFSTTVELRGQADTDHALARQDAAGLLEFLRRRGVLAGTPPALPAPLCQPTPLASSEPVASPLAGVLIFLRAPGETVAAGDAVAEVVCPDTGSVTPLRAQSAGVLYARIATRWVRAGERVCKIAGTALQRTGKLLSA